MLFLINPGYYSRFTEHDDGTFTLRASHGVTSYYRPLDGSPTAGRLERMEDRNGNSLQFLYNQAGQLSTVLDTLGREIAFSYDAEGHLVEVRDFDGQQLLFEYDANGDLVAISQTAVGLPAEQAQVTRYAYLSGYEDVQERLNHNLVRVAGPQSTLDAPDQILTYETNPTNEFTFDGVLQDERWSGEGNNAEYRTTKFEYEALPSALIRVTITDGLGNVDAYEVTAVGGLVKQIELAEGGRRLAQAKVTSYTVNADGETTSITSPEGNQVIYLYDEEDPDRLAKGTCCRRYNSPQEAESR